MSGGDKLERELARFQFKGPGIKSTDEKHFDIMAGEFPSYQVQVESINANEQEILEIGRDARDNRLVATQAGRIVRAVGSLSDGTGYLVDAYGNPLRNAQQVPITPLKRKPQDW